MSEEKNIAVPVEGEPSKDGTDIRYVGFCDILGFSNRISTDFDRTLELYREFGAAVSALPIKGTQITMYSDAVLVTGESLGRVLSAAQALWFVALANDLIIRGAITKGRYWERRESRFQPAFFWLPAPLQKTQGLGTLSGNGSRKDR